MVQSLLSKHAFSMITGQPAQTSDMPGRTCPAVRTAAAQLLACMVDRQTQELQLSFLPSRALDYLGLNLSHSNRPKCSLHYGF
eukprot:jgi/Botrbrau1/1243/Bobra.0163s0036.1